MRGSWYDPSNPPLGKTGKPRQDLYQKICRAADSSDLTLALGTSLTHQQVDLVVERSVQRSLLGECLGLVIVSLQQTPLDGGATLRIFSELDRFLAMLCRVLGVEVEGYTMSGKVVHSAVVPYDITGCLSSTTTTTLNLGAGERVQLWRGGGVGRVMRYCSTQEAWELEIAGCKMLLWRWWLGAARSGGPQFLPVYNVNPTGNCH